MMFSIFSWRKKTRTPRVRRTPTRNRPSLEMLEARELLALDFLSQASTDPPVLDTASGAIIKPFRVQSTSGASSITLSLSEQSSSGTPILGGTVTRPTSGGIATFDDLFVYGGSGTNATFTATAAPAAVGAPLDVETSDPFQVKPGGDHLYLSATIPTTAAGASLGAVTVQELDAGGSVEKNDSTTAVQLVIQDNPGGAQFLDAT